MVSARRRYRLLARERSARWESRTDSSMAKLWPLLRADEIPSNLIWLVARDCDAGRVLVEANWALVAQESPWCPARARLRRRLPRRGAFPFREKRWSRCRHGGNKSRRG